MNLADLFTSDLVRFLASVMLVTFLIILTYYWKLDLASELSVSAIRAFIQMLILTVVLGLLFAVQDLFWIVLALAVMITFASYTSARRAAILPHSFRMTFIAIASSSIAVLAVMVLVGAVQLTAQSLIPLGGMVIGNSMNICSVGMERLTSEVKNQRLRIESILALGGSRDQAIKSPVKKSVKASLIPNVDNLKTIGIVWIPGLMAGMIIAGANIFTAATFQLDILFMILTSGTLASIMATWMLGRRLFTPANQLIYLPASR